MALLALASSGGCGAAAPAAMAAVHRRVRRGALLRRRRAHPGDLACCRRSRASKSAPPRSSRTSCRSPWACSSRCSRSRGTAPGVVGLLFGPVCVLWFAALGVVGVWNIGKAPGILAALDPSHAIRFATSHGVASFVVLGSVLLAITGAEALYADMGHFGKRAIRIAWFGVVAPALVLNYFGQGALLMTRPGGDREPVLPVLPGLGALSDGRAGDGGDGHRLAGDDFRRLLDDAAGDPARVPAAHVDPAHVGTHHRPDLRAGGELDAARRRACRRGRDSARRRDWPRPTASR